MSQIPNRFEPPTWWGRRKPEEFSKMFKNGQNDKKKIHFSLKEIHLCIFTVGWRKVMKKCNVWTDRMLFSEVWLQKCGNLPKQSHFINDERYHPGGGGPRITSFFVIYYHMTEQYSILYYIQSILVRYCYDLRTVDSESSDISLMV